jgi:putative ABC transport system substrate-binding protein
MRRRDVFALLGGAATWPTFAGAQSGRMPRVTVLDWGSATSNRLAPFREMLRSLGYVQGKNIKVDYYYAEGRTDRAEASAAEIVRKSADVIVAFATPAALAVKKATSTIPVVVGTSDPVGAGLVSSLARPGGNVTGISSMMPDLESKRLELLRELLPDLERVALLGSTQDPVALTFVREAQVAARRIGVHMQPVMISSHAEVDAAFARMARDRAGAVIVQPLFVNNAAVAGEIARLALTHRLAAVSNFSHFPRSGGLLSYGAHPDFSRRAAATYVDRILKGASPRDLPVEQPTRFHFVINLKTAAALGIQVPPLLAMRADEAID